MYPNHVLQLICLFSLGISLVLLGVANVLFRTSHPATRVLINLVPSSAVLVGGWFLTNTLDVLLQTSALLALLLVPSMLLDSPRVADFIAKLLAYFRRSFVRWGSVSTAGLLITLGSLWAYDREDQRTIDQSMNDITEMGACPALKETAHVYAKTDRGSRVILREPIDPRTGGELSELEKRVLQSSIIQNHVIRHQEATDVSNCHGWVFTGGRYWIFSVDVEAILSDNNYTRIENPQPGDLVIYRDEYGDPRDVTHSAIVRYVTEGMPVMVEGKWGKTGVYLHAVDQSSYGKNFAYYRSTRNGHLLAGMSNPPILATDD